MGVSVWCIRLWVCVCVCVCVRVCVCVCVLCKTPYRLFLLLFLSSAKIQHTLIQTNTHTHTHTPMQHPPVQYPYTIHSRRYVRAHPVPTQSATIYPVSTHNLAPILSTPSLHPGSTQSTPRLHPPPSHRHYHVYQAGCLTSSIFAEEEIFI